MVALIESYAPNAEAPYRLNRVGRFFVERGSFAGQSRLQVFDASGEKMALTTNERQAPPLAQSRDGYEHSNHQLNSFALTASGSYSFPKIGLTGSLSIDIVVSRDLDFDVLLTYPNTPGIGFPGGNIAAGFSAWEVGINDLLGDSIEVSLGGYKFWGGEYQVSLPDVFSLDEAPPYYGGFSILGGIGTLGVEAAAVPVTTISLSNKVSEAYEAVSNWFK